MSFPFGLLSIQNQRVPSRVRSRCANRILSSERVDDGIITRMPIKVGSEHIFRYQGVTYSSKLALVPLNLAELGGSRGDFGASEEHLVVFG